jgi:hypothetical protein
MVIFFYIILFYSNVQIVTGKRNKFLRGPKIMYKNTGERKGMRLD